MSYAICKGVFDIVPQARESWKDSARWQHVEGLCREIAHLYGMQELRTPAFEHTELFTRSVGETTDIIGKEMYTFSDRAGRSLSLRPEGTAPIVRALLTQGIQSSDFRKVYYLGPMWRYERQQAGRYRQHHQFGAEVIGDPSPERDAELIELLMRLFAKLGLRDLTLMLNSIGDAEARERYKEELKKFLIEKREQLSEDSQRRLDTNPLRILDSKRPEDQAALEGAPMIQEFLSHACAQHFRRVCTSLDALGISYETNPRLVRGLDYYTRTVFEITAGVLGAQNSLGGGGRYDQLLKQLGGPSLPALGFGAGLERILQTMEAQEVRVPTTPRIRVLVVPLGEKARPVCFRLLKQLRDADVSADIALMERKLKQTVRTADNQGIPYVAVVGEDELTQDTCTLKEMRIHKAQTVNLEDLPNYV